eukprot:1265092-Amphidinium_carterae.1
MKVMLPSDDTEPTRINPNVPLTNPIPISSPPSSPDSSPKSSKERFLQIYYHLGLQDFWRLFGVWGCLWGGTFKSLGYNILSMPFRFGSHRIPGYGTILQSRSLCL